MEDILTPDVVYSSSKNVGGASAVIWSAQRRVLSHGGMPRKAKPRAPVPFGEPHHWAYLTAWRDVAGLTQENAAGTLSVSGVTVHRWETGKAPVSAQNMAKLAELYGATDMGMLSLPPPKREQIKDIREAWKIVAALPPDRLADWLAHGRVLSATAKAEGKLTPDEK